MLTRQRGGIRILLEITGLPPRIKAVHIHEAGRCEGPSFESAGAHFNPTKAEHDTANPRGPHAGDLPNVTVDSEGRGHLEVTAKRVRLAPKGADSPTAARSSATSAPTTTAPTPPATQARASPAA